MTTALDHTESRLLRRLASPMVLGLAALLSLVTKLAAEDHWLSQNGLCQHYLVLPADPSAEEVNAAALWADFVSQATGACPPQIREDEVLRPFGSPVYIGHTARASKAGIELQKMRAEQWRHLSVGKDLILTGGRPRGTAYAVSEFIERHLGAAWLDPWTRHIPRLLDWKVPALDVAGEPAFSERIVANPFPSPADAGTRERLLDFQVFNKTSRGGRPRHGGQNLAIPGGGHTFGRFISTSEFAESHPEYFAMNAQGERLLSDQDRGEMAFFQFCPSHPEVRRIVLERARKWLRQDAEDAVKRQREPAHYLEISQNDCTADLCLCPQCRACIERHQGRQSGLLLEFINEIAAAIATDYPKVKVITYAYNFTLQPPPELKPAPNVWVLWCDAYGAAEACRPLDHPHNHKSLQTLRAWSASSPQLGAWDYWRSYPAHMPGFYMPSSNIRALYADAPMLRQHGVQYVIAECEDYWALGNNEFPGTDEMQSFAPLRTWLAAKVLDHPDQPLGPLLDRFFNGYYGAAAPAMRRLLDLIEDAQAAYPHRLIELERREHAQHIITAEVHLQAARHLAEAEKSAAHEPAHLAHVTRERLVFDSAFLWTEAVLRHQKPKELAHLRRSDILARHRADWERYLEANYQPGIRDTVAAAVHKRLDALAALSAAETDATLKVPETSLPQFTDLQDTDWAHAAVMSLIPADSLSTKAERHTLRLLHHKGESLHLHIDLPWPDQSTAPQITLYITSRASVGRIFALSIPASTRPGKAHLRAADIQMIPDVGLRQSPVTGFAPMIEADHRRQDGRWHGSLTLPLRMLPGLALPAASLRVNAWINLKGPDSAQSPARYAWSPAARTVGHSPLDASTYGWLELQPAAPPAHEPAAK